MVHIFNLNLCCLIYFFISYEKVGSDLVRTTYLQWIKNLHHLILSVGRIKAIGYYL